MTPQDAKLDFIRAQLASEHPGWTRQMVFEQSIMRVGMQGFEKTPLASLRGSVAAKQAAEAQLVKASVKTPVVAPGPDPQVSLIMAELGISEAGAKIWVRDHPEE